MPTRVTQEFNIAIGGEVLASLAQATGMSIQQLRSIQDVAKMVNQTAGAVNKEAFGGATQGAQGFHKVLQDIGTTMAGVFSANMATQFFDAAMDGAKKLGDFMKEAGITAAGREQMKMQLGTMLGSGGVPAQASVVNKWVDTLQYFSDTTVIRLNDAADAFRNALTIYTPQASMDMVKHITDIASQTTPAGKSPSEHFKELQETILTTMRGGELMEKGIRPLEKEGVNLRPYLEKKLNIEGGGLGKLGTEMTEEQIKLMEDGLHTLYKDIKKGDVPAKLLQDFIEDSTKEGGFAYKGAERAGQGAIGGWNTLLDKFQNIMVGIGSIELGPFEGIINRINAAFTPEAFQNVNKFFADTAAKVQASFDLMIAGWDKVDKSGMFKAFEGLWRSLGKVFEVLPDGKNQGPELVGDNTAAIQAWTAQLTDMVQVFKDIIEITSKFVLAFKSIKTALDNFVNNIPDLSKLWGSNGKDPIANPGAGPPAPDSINPKRLKPGALLPGAHLAEGGIVTSAQMALVGEAGPEAIIPLDILANSPLVEATKEAVESHLKVAEELGNLSEVLKTLPMTLASGAGGAAGGIAGFGGASTGAHETDYGASVPGDQPGGPTYDSNSYHGIGAGWAKRHLQLGDVAMHEAYGRSIGAHHNMPFIDPNTGQTKIWMDASGSKDPMNIDNYRGARGGLIKKPTRLLAGEAGPELLTPLDKVGKLGGGGNTVNINIEVNGTDLGSNLSFYAQQIANEVRHVFDIDREREAFV